MEQIYANISVYGKTPASDLFFNAVNMAFLKRRLEEKLSELTGGEPIIVNIDADFILKMTSIVDSNPGSAYSGVKGLNFLNKSFLESETSVQYCSLRNRKLFYKYFIDGDRMRVFPYGEGTHVTRGEVTVCPSGYLMSDPRRKQYQQFLRTVR